MSIAIVPVVVPPSGDGPIANISALVGSKTVTLTGFFQGVYTLLASHNGANFVPVLIFNSDGSESIKLTLPDAYASVRVRAGANTVPGGIVTMTMAGVSKPGENLFATLTTFAPGSSGGMSPVVDTSLLFPPTGLEAAINFICTGGLVGTVLVEGSNDGVGWGGIGSFQAGERQRPLLGLSQPLEFSPLSTGDNSRYLRFTLDGQADSLLTITVGGNIPTTSSSSAESLIIDEDEGRAVVQNGGISVEEILYEWVAPFTALPANVSAQLDGIAKVLPVIAPPAFIAGTLRVYVGATSPGDTTGGTLVLTSASITNNADASFNAAGAPFANPGGNILIQITGEVTAPGEGPADELHVRGITLTIG